MAKPSGFTWINKPLLAGMAEPLDLEEFKWLREQSVQILVSLTEDAPNRRWVNESGLMLIHEPIPDMTAPTPEQLDRLLAAIRRANEHDMGVAVHCGAGLGRTGVVLACYFVDQGLSAQNAVARVRRLRPGSIETTDQADAVTDYARRHGHPGPAAE
jgi:atypical dual specificity phosphatase